MATTLTNTVSRSYKVEELEAKMDAMVEKIQSGMIGRMEVDYESTLLRIDADGDVWFEVPYKVYADDGEVLTETYFILAL